MASVKVSLYYLCRVRLEQECPVCFLNTVDAHLLLVNESIRVTWRCARKCNLREVS